MDRREFLSITSIGALATALGVSQPDPLLELGIKAAPIGLSSSQGDGFIININSGLQCRTWLLKDDGLPIFERNGRAWVSAFESRRGGRPASAGTEVFMVSEGAYVLVPFCVGTWKDMAFSASLELSAATKMAKNPALYGVLAGLVPLGENFRMALFASEFPTVYEPDNARRHARTAEKIKNGEWL